MTLSSSYLSSLHSSGPSRHLLAISSDSSSSHPVILSYPTRPSPLDIQSLQVAVPHRSLRFTTFSLICSWIWTLLTFMIFNHSQFSQTKCLRFICMDTLQYSVVYCLLCLQRVQSKTAVGVLYIALEAPQALFHRSSISLRHMIAMWIRT